MNVSFDTVLGFSEVSKGNQKLIKFWKRCNFVHLARYKDHRLVSTFSNYSVKSVKKQEEWLFVKYGSLSYISPYLVARERWRLCKHGSSCIDVINVARFAKCIQPTRRISRPQYCSRYARFKC